MRPRPLAADRGRPEDAARVHTQGSTVADHDADLERSHGKSSVDVLDGIEWLVRMRTIAGLALVAVGPAVWLILRLVDGIPALATIGGRAFPVPVNDQFDVPYVPLLAAAGVVLALNALYGAAARRLRSTPRSTRRTTTTHVLAHVQVALDLVTLTVLTHFLGGIESPIPLYMIFHIVGVASILSLRSAYAHAVLGILMLGALANLEYYGTLPHHSLFAFDPPVELFRQANYLGVYFTVLASMLVFMVFLTQYLTRKVERTQRELRARAVELLSFSKAATLVSRDFDLPAALDQVMGRFQEIYGAAGYALDLADPASSAAERRVARGDVAPALDRDPADSALVVDGTADQGPMARIPLRAGDRRLGWLTVSKGVGLQFEPIEISLLETIASNIALAATNAGLYGRVEREAKTDGLTGLLNHREFCRRLEDELERARRHGRHLSVAILDVDRFKLYNDEFGHLVGDEVLRALARILTDVVRRSDLVARYGGEEFALLLPDTESGAAEVLAERLRSRLDEHVFGDDLPEGARHVTASIGVATWHADSRSDAPGTPDAARALLARADEALYAAKAAGRNRVVVAERGDARAGLVTH